MRQKTRKNTTIHLSGRHSDRVVRVRKQMLVGIVLLCIGLVGARLLSFSFASTVTAKVADHPQAVLQATAAGKRLHTLKTWNGKIYAGFGDYGANTGPIAITPFDGTSFGAQQIAADTEAIYLFREIQGKLYGLSADPKSSADVVIGTVADGTVSWVNKRFTGMTHVYDVFTYTGSDLWIVGSQGVYARAYRSLDGGVTWQLSLSVANQNTTRTDDFARFYGAIVHGGKIYVQATDFYGTLHPTSKIFDGQTWADGPSLGNFNSATTFAGQTVFHSGYHVANWGYLGKFDGSTVTALKYIYNYTIDGNTLYALSTDGKGTIYKTTDLINWTTVGATTANARSIAVLNGEIFVGDTDAAIYKVQVTDTDIVQPTVNISSPVHGQIVSGSVTVSGAASDNEAVTKVEMFVDNTLHGTDTSSPYSFTWDTRKISSGTHVISWRAHDAVGNVASATISVGVDNGGAGIPTMPPNFRVTAMSSNQVSLAWGASTDNVAVAGYRLIRNGIEIYRGTALSFNDTGLNASTTYAYDVSAFDGSGNYSPAANVSATTTAAQKTADLNGDSVVNVFDLSILLSAWGQSGVLGDINTDGIVNVFDLSMLLANWSK